VTVPKTGPQPPVVPKNSPPAVVPPPVASRPVTPPPQTAGTAAAPQLPPRVVNSVPASADKPQATSTGRAATPPQGAKTPPMPELLTDPVPRVTAILVSADRRLATVGDEGQIIAVGDTVGRRVVIAIDDRTVLLREPSGVQIRVALGGRVVGVERGGR